MATKKKKKTKIVRPFGSKWRVSMINAGIKGDITSATEVVLDEVVLEDIFHLEMMDTNHYWLRVGDHVLNIHRGRHGKMTVRHEIDK
jgi:hypothetical protein